MYSALDSVAEALASYFAVGIDLFLQQPKPLQICVAGGFLAGIIVLLIKLKLKGKLRHPGHGHRAHIEKSYRVLDQLADLVKEEKYQAAFGMLRKTDAYVFEECVLSAFERSGAVVHRSERYSGDGGIDGKVRYGKQTYLVQSKRYQRHIKKSDVHRHAKLCDRHRCKGLFVHTGRTGKGARRVEAEGPVTIISGKLLIDILSGYSPAIWVLEE